MVDEHCVSGQAPSRGRESADPFKPLLDALERRYAEEMEQLAAIRAEQERLSKEIEEGESAFRNANNL